MASKTAQKLFERMCKTKSDWKASDLIRLYEGFGFAVSHGSKHDIVRHPLYPLRTTLPRHNYLATVYVDQAIILIKQLQYFQEKDHERPSKDTG
jgi:hypothetical protein